MTSNERQSRTLRNVLIGATIVGGGVVAANLVSEYSRLQGDMSDLTATAAVENGIRQGIQATQTAQAQESMPSITATPTATPNAQEASAQISAQIQAALDAAPESPSILSNSSEVVAFDPNQAPSTEDFIREYQSLLRIYDTLSENDRVAFLQLHPGLQVVLAKTESSNTAQGLAGIRTNLEVVLRDEAATQRLIESGEACRSALVALPDSFRDESQLARREFAINLGNISADNVVVVDQQAVITSSVYGQEVMATAYCQAYALVRSHVKHLGAGLSEAQMQSAAASIAQTWLEERYQPDQEAQGNARTRTIYAYDADTNQYYSAAVVSEFVNAETRVIHQGPDRLGADRRKQSEETVCIELPELRNRPATFGTNLDSATAHYNLLVTSDQEKIIALMQDGESFVDAILGATDFVLTHLTDKTEAGIMSVPNQEFNLEGNRIDLPENPGVLILENGCLVSVPVGLATQTSIPGMPLLTPTATPNMPTATGTPDRRPSITPGPSLTPTFGPTEEPTDEPTVEPTDEPTVEPTDEPTPTWEPSATKLPSVDPTATQPPLNTPVVMPTSTPGSHPGTPVPTAIPF